MAADGIQMMAGGDGCVGGAHGYREDVAAVCPVGEIAHACGWENGDIVIIDRLNGDLVSERRHGDCLVVVGCSGGMSVWFIAG